MLWWWLADAVLLLVVIPLVAFQARRLLMVAGEIRDYVADVATQARAVARNLEATAQLGATAELTSRARHLSAAYASQAARRMERGA